MKLAISLLGGFLAAALPSAAQIKITRDDLSLSARFGATVLVRDGLVYVGAPWATINGNTLAGIVYIYDAATGAERGYIRRTNPAPNDQFGTSLAIAGDRLFIGAPGRSGPEYGSVFYTALPVNGSRFTESSFHAPDAASNSGFGAALAAREDGQVFVGAPDGTPSGSRTGNMYDFAGLMNPPVFTGSYLGPGAAGTRWGAAVAASNDGYYAVSAPYYPSSSSQAGTVFIGAADGGGGYFTPPGLPDFSSFGESLAAAGSRILAGTPDYESSPDRNNAGAAFLIDAGTRSLVRRFDPDEIGGRFGGAVALTRLLAVIGASYSGVSAREGGAVYLFRAALKRKETSVVFPVAPGDLGERDHFGAAVSTDGAWLAVGAPDADANGVEDSGAIYVYSLSAPRPVVKPKPKQVAAAGPSVKIKGIARRGFHAIARVEYSLKRGGKYKPLRGAARWHGAVRIKETTRKIFVRACDAAGTTSKIAVVRLVR